MVENQPFSCVYDFNEGNDNYVSVLYLNRGKLVDTTYFNETEGVPLGAVSCCC